MLKNHFVSPHLDQDERILENKLQANHKLLKQHLYRLVVFIFIMSNFSCLIDQGGHLSSLILQLVKTALLIVVIPFLLEEETPLILGLFSEIPNKSECNKIFVSFAKNSLSLKLKTTLK